MHIFVVLRFPVNAELMGKKKKKRKNAPHQQQSESVKNNGYYRLLKLL